MGATLALAADIATALAACIIAMYLTAVWGLENGNKVSISNWVPADTTADGQGRMDEKDGSLARTLRSIVLGQTGRWVTSPRVLVLIQTKVTSATS